MLPPEFLLRFCFTKNECLLLILTCKGDSSLIYYNYKSSLRGRVKMKNHYFLILG